MNCMRNKLSSMCNYFEKLKHDLKESAQIKIKYYWLRFKKRAHLKKAGTNKINTKGKGKHKQPHVKKGSAVYKQPPGLIAKKSFDLLDESHEKTEKKESAQTLKSEDLELLKVDSNLATKKYSKFRPIDEDSVEEED